MAHVPYAFPPVRVSEMAREREIRVQINANAEKYYKTKEELQAMMEQSLWSPLDVV
jgi:histidinol phosphatase-like PHP family hydrolase